jgi:hypothetical protein
MNQVHVTFDLVKTIETARVQEEIMTWMGDPMVREQPRDAIAAFFQQCTSTKFATVVVEILERSEDERAIRGYYARRDKLCPKFMECRDLVSKILEERKELQEYTIVLMAYSKEKLDREKAALIRRVKSKDNKA